MLPDFGDYNIYIWPSYGVTILVLGALTAWILYRNAKVRAELKALEDRRAKQKDAA
ncbi:MAG: heme exporter protein CcmD [Neomegalonema sp.]|nr:heme exporter protein CcmD [Neomegalonema sp.]